MTSNPATYPHLAPFPPWLTYLPPLGARYLRSQPMSPLEGSDHKKSLSRLSCRQPPERVSLHTPVLLFRSMNSLRLLPLVRSDLWWLRFRNLTRQSNVPLCEHPTSLNGPFFAWRRSPPHTGTCAYNFNHTVNSLLFSFLKLKIYHKHHSTW